MLTELWPTLVGVYMNLLLHSYAYTRTCYNKVVPRQALAALSVDVVEYVMNVVSVQFFFLFFFFFCGIVLMYAEFSSRLKAGSEECLSGRGG